MVISSVESSVKETLVIDPSYKSKGLQYKDVSVIYNVPVDKFTEGSLTLPFKIKNVPNNLSVQTFPKNVKVTYKVGLKDYNKVSESLFKIECDYLMSVKNDLSFFIPKIIASPSFVKDVKLHTQKIDFFTTQQ